MRPIDADAVMEELEALREDCKNDHDDDGYYAVESSLYIVKNATALDVHPVVHGHWIEGWDTKCSICGMSFSEMPFSYDAEGGPDWVTKYCPNCGNPMDGKEDEDNE